MKRSLFSKWLLTYLTLTLVAILFISGIYQIYINSINENLRRTNEVYLEKIVNHFNYAFDSLDVLVYNLGLEPRITRLTNFDTSLTNYERYGIVDAHRNLSLIARSNSFLQDIYLYIDRPDLLIVNDSAYFGELIELSTLDAFRLSPDTFRSLLAQSHSRTIIRLREWHKESSPLNPLLYIQSIPFVLGSSPRGTLIVSVNENALGEWGENTWFPESVIVVRDAEDRILFTNRDEYYNAPSLIPPYNPEGTPYVQFRSTDSRGWTYTSLVSRENYLRPVRQIGAVALFVALIFFGLNIIIAYFFANRMYQPVKKLMISINDAGYELNQSEFEVIEQVITKSRFEQIRMKKELDTQVLELRQAFLSRVFRGFIKDPLLVQTNLEKFGISISEVGFKVVLFKISREDSRLNDSGVPRFLAQNILEETLSSALAIYSVEIEDRISFLVSPTVPDESLLWIEDKVRSTAILLQENFDIRCEAGISQTHRYILAFSNAYHESLEAVQNVGVLGTSQVIQYESLQDMKALYEFSLDDEYKLFNFIKLGDLEQALLHIDAIVERNRETHQIKLGYLQCLMFDLVSAIIKSVHHEAFSELINQNSPIQRMMKADNLDTMKKIVLEVVTVACEVYTETDLEKSSALVAEKLERFIQEHFSDMNLNVSKLADEFGMSPTYLSKIYKKETGSTVSTAINSERVSAAEKLLLETNKGIGEIAEEVGYYYSNAFIRFFKGHTGVTPGQYRVLHGKPEE